MEGLELPLLRKQLDSLRRSFILGESGTQDWSSDGRGHEWLISDG